MKHFMKQGFGCTDDYPKYVNMSINKFGQGVWIEMGESGITGSVHADLWTSSWVASQLSAD